MTVISASMANPRLNVFFETRTERLDFIETKNSLVISSQNRTDRSLTQQYSDHESTTLSQHFLLIIVKTRDRFIGIESVSRPLLHLNQRIYKS
ncbi:hypothetical protein EVAR_102567_1 [Eumeta japonica]|uniref:Uncharacterized protein n=1 Tax=Eumeta variegata TaxID=151549 RepID=A0A4C1SP57_EUMVA|nr:hypothetical protein EVAR_102567_1 [Eumeta japonica]